MLAQLRGNAARLNATQPRPGVVPHTGPGGPNTAQRVLRSRGGEAAYRPALPITATSLRPRELHRMVSRRPATSRVGRLVGLVKAALGGDTTATAHTGALARLQTPVPTGRRVVVTGAHGGAGASTVALLLAEAFHLYRPDGVALLDACGHHGGLLSRLARAPTMSVAGAHRHLSAGNVTAVLRPQSHPVWVVLTPPAETPVTVNVAARLQRKVGVSVIDAGSRHGGRERVDRSGTEIGGPSRGAGDLLFEGVDVAVVVCDNTVRGAACAQALVQDCVAVGIRAAAVVVVIVERETDSGITVDQVRREILRESAATVALLPRDRHLAGGAHIHSHLLAPRTRHAVTALAADVIAASVAPR